MTATQTFLNQTSAPRKCTACGSVLQGRWETLSPGLCRTLVKIVAAVDRTGTNAVHLQHDVDLSKNEFANAQKLRYFGLIAKVEDRSGHWLVTSRGRQFATGVISLPKKVYVFHNAVDGHSDERTSISDAIGQTPTWLKREDYRPPLHEMQQAALF